METELLAPTILAYIAGIVDGEGYIGIVKQRGTGNQISMRYHIQVNIGMTDETLIRWIVSCFPGVLRFYWKKEKIEGRSDAYLAIAMSRKAATFLRAIRPYLRLKARQADLALEFTDSYFCGQSYKPAAKGTARVPLEVTAHREDVYQRMRDLNSRRKGPQHTNPRSPSGLAAD